MSSGNGRLTPLSFELAEVPQAASEAPPHRDRDDDAPELVFDLEEPEPTAASYRGPLGRTRSRTVRVRSGGALIAIEVLVAVNADTDPDLGRRARGELAAPLHALMLAGEPIDLAIPFVYHEPSRGLFALVVPPELRHRELEERLDLLTQLQLEPPGIPIPEYVLQLGVVIGAAGLAAWRSARETPAQRAQAQRDARPQLDARRSDEDRGAAPGAAAASAGRLGPLGPVGPMGTDADSAPLRRGPRTFGPASSQALHTLHGIHSAASIPGLSSIAGAGTGSAALSAVPTAASDGADATTATASPPALDPGDPGDAGDASDGEAATSATSATSASPARTPSAPSSPSGPGSPTAGAAPAASTPARSPLAPAPRDPVEACSSPVPGPMLGMSSGPSSGPVTAAEAALESAPRHLRAPSAHDLGWPKVHTPLSPSRVATPTDPAGLVLEPPITPYVSASRTRTIDSAFDRIIAAGRHGEPDEPNERPAFAELPVGDVSATPDTIDEDLSAGLSRAVRELPPESDPLTTEARDQPVYEPDEWLAQVIAAGACDLTVEQGRARVALAADAIRDADVLRGPLDVRIVLHRAAAFPVVVLLFGSPAGLRSDRRDQIAAMCLDVSAERDRAVLAQLARGFEIVVEVFAGKRWLRRVLLSAPLADNAAYVLRAADDHLHQLGAQGSALSVGRAFEQVSHPGYDVTGAHHPDAPHFRDGLLVAVRTAAKLRRALAMAQRFARPEGEDYLVCVRGFPLMRWRRLRRHVLEQAVTWGLWMGAELARVAVSEGLARSRRDLVHRLHDGFALLQTQPAACDLDADARAENTEALAAEARALGVTPGKARTLFDSEMDSVIAGTIDLPSGPVLPVSEQTLGELVHALEVSPERLAAALEICRRQASSAAAPLVASISRMSRTEAVAVLAGSVRLGTPAAAPLITALASSKAYVRQGAALALGHLRTHDAVTALVALLLDEPTEIWKEVARGLGLVGPQGLHELARALRDRQARLGQGGPIDPALEERFTWALAHLGARDCLKPLAQMAGGQGAMAPVATRALALVESARADQEDLLAQGDLSEMTMNRTFSRQFFSALAGAAEGGQGDDGRRGGDDDGDDDGDDGAYDSFEDNGGEHGSQVIALDAGLRGQRRSLSESEL